MFKQLAFYTDCGNSGHDFDKKTGNLKLIN